MEIQNPRLFQFVWIGPWPSPRAATGFGRGTAGARAGPLRVEFPLHRRDGADDGQEAAARGGRGIDRLPCRDKLNPLRFEEPHNLEEVRGAIRTCD